MSTLKATIVREPRDKNLEEPQERPVKQPRKRNARPLLQRVKVHLTLSQAGHETAFRLMKERGLPMGYLFDELLREHKERS